MPISRGEIGASALGAGAGMAGGLLLASILKHNSTLRDKLLFAAGGGLVGGIGANAMLDALPAKAGEGSLRDQMRRGDVTSDAEPASYEGGAFDFITRPFRPSYWKTTLSAMNPVGGTTNALSTGAGLYGGYHFLRKWQPKLEMKNWLKSQGAASPADFVKMRMAAGATQDDAIKALKTQMDSFDTLNKSTGMMDLLKADKKRTAKYLIAGVALGGLATAYRRTSLMPSATRLKMMADYATHNI